MEFNFLVIRNTLQTPLGFSDLATKWIQCNGSSEQALRAQREETRLSSLDYSQKVSVFLVATMRSYLGAKVQKGPDVPGKCCPALG